MIDLNKAIRSKRFEVKANANVELIVTSPFGNQLTFKVIDCSMNSVGVNASTVLTEADGFADGTIISAAKLKWPDQEISLGRLVVRGIRAKEDGSSCKVGFQMIDGKFPVTGQFSKVLEPSKDQKGGFDFELSSDNFSLASFAQNDQSNVDMFERCRQFSIFFEEWKNSPQYQYHLVRTASKGSRINLTRSRSSRRNDYIIMGSNDYLGMSSHPEVLEAAKNAIDKYGVGSTGSPLTTGVTDLHTELCDVLAKMYKKDRAMLYNSGYTANVGSLTGLTGPQDLIAVDALAHASIHDGIQMSHATGRIYKHNDFEHLNRLLEEQRGNYAGTLVVTEGIFSMDGDVAKLDKIAKVAKSHNCRIFVDEAHSLGVIGPNGYGVCDKYGLEDSVDVVMGTFSKICGGIGGFIAADREVIDWLNYFSRGYMFTVSIPPASAAAALMALRVFNRDKQILENLRRNIKHFVSGIRALGANISSEHESAVIPVVIGDHKKMGIMSEVLRDAGVYVIPIVYPAVSRNACRFRFTVMSQHTLSDLDYALAIVEKAMKVADFSFQQEQSPAVSKILKAS